MITNLSRILWLEQDRVTRAVCISFAGLFSFAYLVGSKVEVATGTFDRITWFFMASFLLLTCLSYFILIGLYGVMRHIEPLLWQKKEKIAYRKAGMAIFVFIFLCWLPYFLIYYPGSMTYDSYDVTGQAVLGFAPSDWHPFTYTLLVRLIMRFGMLFGDINAGIAAYTLCQMAFLAGAVAYGICWLYRKQLNLYFVGFIVLFFAIIPIFPVLSISMWKDIPFAACILLYTLFLYDVLESKGKNLCCRSGTLKFIFLASLIALLRHNGYYIILLTAVLLAIYFRKILKKVWPSLLLPILLVPMIQNIYYASGVAEGVFSESLSIPAQQIARTVVYNGTINEEEWGELNCFFDVEQLYLYDPFLADPAKNSFNRDYLASHKLQFLKLWAELMPSNFKEYCKAYIMETLGYWMPRVHNWIVLPLAGEGEKIGVDQINLLQRFTGDIWDDLGNLYHFFSIGTMVWTAAFLIGLTLIKRRASDLIALMPLFTLWLTIMAATPVYCEFRYILALPLALPFIACMSFRKQDTAERVAFMESDGK